MQGPSHLMASWYFGEALGLRSPLECFGDRADAWLVRTVRGGAPVSGRVRWLIWGAVLLVVIAVLAPLR